MVWFFYTGREALITSILQNEVTIILGETGSGKTTQIPQYLLPHLSTLVPPSSSSSGTFYAPFTALCNCNCVFRDLTPSLPLSIQVIAIK
jgi:energy-coupling factor transporter ATP-binding protein EcfA2